MTAATWLGKVEVSGHARNRTLIRRMKQGDDRAREDLVVANLPLACMVAGEVAPYAPFEMDFGDVLAECVLLMVSAAQTYDDKKGKFSTHAAVHMRARIRRAWSRYSSHGTVIQHDATRLGSYKLLLTGAHELGESTRPENIAKVYDVPLEYCKRMDTLMRLPDPYSMNVTVSNPHRPFAEGRETYGDGLAAPDDVPSTVEALLASADLSRTLRQLPQVQREVVIARFVDRQSLGAIASEMNVRRIDVRRIEREALKALAEKLPSEAAA